MIFEDVHYIEVDADAQKHHGPTLVRIHHGHDGSQETVASVSAKALVIRALSQRSERVDDSHIRIFFDKEPVAQFEDGLLCIMPDECLLAERSGNERDTEIGWHWGVFSR